MKISNGLAGAGMSSGHNNSGGSSSSNQQHYCLRWNNHQHNLLGVLESVLTSQQHADVSLFCEGHVLRVHKLVLLASSSHFERILEATPAGQQPVIILDGTRFADLKALVDYMYRGEVNIEQDQLSSLLRTAETLKIKGLADVATKEEDDRGGGNGGGGNGGGNDPGRGGEGSNSIVTSPPAKRSKSSPIDNGPSSSRDTKDRDHRDQVQVEPRDFSREGPRDLTRDISSHFGLGNNYPSARRAPSPSHSMVSARSLLYSSTLISSRQSGKSPVPSLSSAPYFSGSLIRSRSPHHQFDPAPGSSVHPPRTSPQSPAPDHKIAPQITMPPFGLPFSLPMLHDSKKMLERPPHALLPSHYDDVSPRDDRDSKDYLPSSWPPRGADLDAERERELRERDKEIIREREKEIIREREKDIIREREKDIIREREKDIRERDRERDHENEWERDREKNTDLVSDRIQLAHHHQQSLHQAQAQLSQQHQQLILQQHLQKKALHEPLPSPLQLSQVLQTKQNNVPKLELLDKVLQDPDRRTDDDKFSSSPEKDTSFSPPEDFQQLHLSGRPAIASFLKYFEHVKKQNTPKQIEDDTHSVSSKTEYTPEGDNVDDDEDSSGSLRDSLIPTGNGEITSTITSTTNNGRPPSGSSTASTPATATGDSVKCPYCPRSYRHQNNLRTHIRCFHKGVRIPCPICRRGFTRWFTVRCHIAREHQNYDFNQPEQLPAQLRRALYPPFAE